MHPDFLPRDFDGCLAHLIEECGEVLKDAGKLLRFGPDEWSPFDPSKTPNIDALQSEMADLRNAIDRLQIIINHIKE